MNEWKICYTTTHCLYMTSHKHNVQSCVRGSMCCLKRDGAIYKIGGSRHSVVWSVTTWYVKLCTCDGKKSKVTYAWRRFVWSLTAQYTNVVFFYAQWRAVWSATSQCEKLCTRNGVLSETWQRDIQICVRTTTFCLKRDGAIYKVVNAQRRVMWSMTARCASCVSVTSVCLQCENVINTIVYVLWRGDNVMCYVVHTRRCNIWSATVGCAQLGTRDGLLLETWGRKLQKLSMCRGVLSVMACYVCTKACWV